MTNEVVKYIRKGHLDSRIYAQRYFSLHVRSKRRIRGYMLVWSTRNITTMGSIERPLSVVVVRRATHN